MDVKQAKAYLEDFIEYAGKDGIGVPSREPYDLAIQAFEKQIPKKIVKAFDEKANVYWCSCPVCANGLGWEHTISDINYCFNCGTAIDWSKEEQNV